MNYTIVIDDINHFILYLNDIDSYVNSILNYYNGYEADLDEIIMYLSCIHEIIENLKLFIYEKYYD